MLIANINRREDSLVGPLVKGVHMASVEDALAEKAFAKECPVDLLNEVPEKRKAVSRGEGSSNLRRVVQRENLPQPEGKPDVLEDGGVQGGGDLQVERLQPLVELDDHLDTVHIPDLEVGQLGDVFDEHALEEGVQVSSDGVHFNREVGGGSDLDLNLKKKIPKLIQLWAKFT